MNAGGRKDARGNEKRHHLSLPKLTKGHGKN
jgi:hypothetical protein